MNAEDGLPDLPGIDKADGLRRIMNKPALYEKILRDFQARLIDAPHIIRDLLTSGDLESAERLVHSSKGLAGTIGALALQDATKELELALRNGERPSDTALAKFEAELRTVINGITVGFGINQSD
jgi:HPt (histidine-containing phosphotransfer) domain-containing protein